MIRLGLIWFGLSGSAHQCFHRAHERMPYSCQLFLKSDIHRSWVGHQNNIIA